MKISTELQSLYQLACASDLNLLISGGSGVGKTRLAKKIHREGSRGSGPCRVIPLASLEERDLESLLLGHSGLEAASVQISITPSENPAKGSLILDGLEKASLKSQEILFQFMKPSKRDSRMDSGELRLPRIIATAHSEIYPLAARGLFRQDLLNCLSQIYLPLPRFEERGWDFDHILHECLEEISQTRKKKVYGLAEDAALSLETCLWPGNYRELHRVLEFAVRSSRARCLTREDLPLGYR